MTTRKTLLLSAAAAASVMMIAAPAQAAPGAGGSGMSPTTSRKTINPQESYQEGLAAIDEGDFKTAEKRFGEVLMAAPDHAHANYYMGLAKVGLGKDKSSVRYFEKAIESTPNFVEAREQLALVFVRIGKEDKATEQLTALRDLQAQCAGGACGDAGVIVDNAVANVEAALGVAPEEAAEAADGGDGMETGAADEDESAAVESGARFAGLLLRRAGDGADQYRSAVRFINEARYDEAIADLYETSAMVGPHPDVLNYLGFAHRKLGKMEKAQDYYAQALTLDPDHLGANEYLGELYLEIGEVDKARAQLAKLDALCAFGCAEREDLARLIEIKESARRAEK